ncbi:hypothetical protein CDL12_29131 [Handroanthus impetiginosus]|uniref:Uncharacterized protein n=1 Tax=Handroanthus impetiginosus TaxID=429701 RepID=A0A2G9FZM5_9LAMI|nr:hypothetical protein CDL12_29131 [Handroanthus impetiginosus]
MLLIQEPFVGESLHTKDMQDDTTDEADEALSLCDLPLNSDHGIEEYWGEDLSIESQGSSSMSSAEQDYFEFFSQELNSSTSSFPPENIIFCGKLIPYKQLDTREKDSSKVDESGKKQKNIEKKQGWGIFRWKFSSTRQVQSKNGKKSTTVVHKKDHHASRSLHDSRNKMHNSNKQGKGYDFPVHKLSMLTSSSSGKARWYQFMFGISRFSTEVELRDIKSRMSRRHCPSPPPPSPLLSRNSGLGLWRLIRILSCGANDHPNTLVAASITCSPQK